VRIAASTIIEPSNSRGSIVRCLVNDRVSVPGDCQDRRWGPPSLLDRALPALETEGLFCTAAVEEATEYYVKAAIAGGSDSGNDANSSTPSLFRRPLFIVACAQPLLTIN
jgi:hypothetical protein